jgi:hypothetical protein
VDRSAFKVADSAANSVSTGSAAEITTCADYNQLFPNAAHAHSANSHHASCCVLCADGKGDDEEEDDHDDHTTTTTTTKRHVVACVVDLDERGHKR